MQSTRTKNKLVFEYNTFLLELLEQDFVIQHSSNLEVRYMYI